MWTRMVSKSVGSLAMGSWVDINENKNGTKTIVHLYIDGLKLPINCIASCAKQIVKYDYVLVGLIRHVYYHFDITHDNSKISRIHERR